MDITHNSETGELTGWRDGIDAPADAVATMTPARRLARVRRAAQRLTEADAALRVEVVAAIAHAVPVAQAADAAGVSRVTAYRWEREARAAEEVGA